MREDERRKRRKRAHLGQVPDVSVHDHPEITLLVVLADLVHRDQLRPPHWALGRSRGLVQLHGLALRVEVEGEDDGGGGRHQDL